VGSYQATFGRAPAGMWPSEGAVSRLAIELIRDQPTIRWVATDEHVLARALGQQFERDEYGHLRDPRPLYQPYCLDGQLPAIFFRDLAPGVFASALTNSPGRHTAPAAAGAAASRWAS